LSYHRSRSGAGCCSTSTRRLRTAISPKDRIIVALNADGTNVNLVGTYEVMTVDYMRGDLECEARLRVVD
jgi:hypothetical protein